jgi:hypothetical protein
LALPVSARVKRHARRGSGGVHDGFFDGGVMIAWFARIEPRTEESDVGLLSRRKSRPGTLRTASSADVDHLVDFIRTRQGVEAFVEPRTTVTDTTIVLVAADGEWTRRRVDGPDGAASFAKKQSIPLYDVAKLGYPQRMRDWNERRKGSGEPGSNGSCP